MGEVESEAVPGQPWSQFHNVLGLKSFGRRLDILRRQYLNHRFDRRSPLDPLPDHLLSRIYDHEVTLPPRRLLMQPGAQTIDGLLFVASLAAALEARTVFEIGTFTGVTTWTLARNLPEASVHTLDIPPEGTPTWTVEKDDVHRGSEENLVYKRLPAGGEITQHWSDSATFDFSPWYDTIDLVYIDGAHSEPYVRSDTDNALRMMSGRGAVVWDDYWRLSPGVVKVLHERSDIGLHRIPGTRLVVHVGRDAEEAILRGPRPT
jgi:predicted O-methyltransferase YrrM